MNSIHTNFSGVNIDNILSEEQFLSSSYLSSSPTIGTHLPAAGYPLLAIGNGIQAVGYPWPDIGAPSPALRYGSPASGHFAPIPCNALSAIGYASPGIGKVESTTGQRAFNTNVIFPMMECKALVTGAVPP